MVSKSIKKSDHVFYAVSVGRKPGIYTTWPEAFEQIKGFSRAQQRKFKTRAEAAAFLASQSQATSSVVPSTSSASSGAASKAISVFTDGACSNNGRVNAKAGYAVVFPEHSSFDVSSRLEGKVQTNNRAEYSAVISALQQANKINASHSQPVHIYTDSQLLIDSIMNYLPTWKSNNWRKSGGGEVLNKDLLMTIDELTRKRKVSFFHVPAHTGSQDWASRWNAQADFRAQMAAQ